MGYQVVVVVVVVVVVRLSLFRFCLLGKGRYDELRIKN